MSFLLTVTHPTRPVVNVTAADISRAETLADEFITMGAVKVLVQNSKTLDTVFTALPKEEVTDADSMPKKWKSVVLDAKKIGLRVEVLDKRFRIKKGSVLVDLWEDGSATRADVDAALATNLRTAKNVRSVLGLSLQSAKSEASAR